jgi:outer membrane protein assembly factor BamD
MRKSILSILVLIAIVAGCSSIGNIRKENAEDQYEVARKLYDRGKYFQAAEAFRLMIFNFSGVSYIDSVQYFLGMCYFNDREYILGVAEFKRLVKNFPQSSLADDGQFMIGKSYYLAAPNNIGLDQTETYTAITELQNFVEDFPDSPLLDEGKQLLAECRAKITKKLYESGLQYYKMGMHQAARVYFEDIISERQSPEWRGCSLYLLAEMDIKEHKYADAALKLNNFLQTFPGHKWEHKAKKKLEEIQSEVDQSAVASDTI